MRVDDEDDFAFLEKQHDIADVLANQTDSGDEDDNGGSENVAPVESVDSLEIRKALQDRAEEGVRVKLVLTPSMGLIFCQSASGGGLNRSERRFLAGPG